jgi:hypothetical protein
VSVLKALREALVSDLAALNVPVYATWPTQIDPPCLYVLPPLSAAYLTAGPNFGGEFTASLDVAIIAAHEPAGAALETVEELLELTLINTADWLLDAVEPPAPITVTDSGAEYLGALVHLSKSVRLF